jgi:predicted TIM-barrel fold metal-dependent hydrolase
MALVTVQGHVFDRYPTTQVIVLHVGNDAENLPYVSECMDRFPNMTVEPAARIGELGRQPRMSRNFFDKYQDRIIFGTDASPMRVPRLAPLVAKGLHQCRERRQLLIAGLNGSSGKTDVTPTGSGRG